MAVSRVQTSSIVQGFPKSRSLLAGNPGYVPPSFESIATATGTGSSNTITFSSIPSTFKHLQVRIMGRSTNNNLASSTIVNGSTTGYARHYLFGTGGIALASGNGSLSSLSWVDFVTSSNSTSGMMGVGILDIYNYASTTANKTFRMSSGFDTNNGSDGNLISLQSGLWANTSAITSIDFRLDGFANYWTTNTVIALYGIKG